MTTADLKQKGLELAEEIELSVNEGRFHPVVKEDASLLRDLVKETERLEKQLIDLVSYETEEKRNIHIETKAEKTQEFNGYNDEVSKALWLGESSKTAAEERASDALTDYDSKTWIERQGSPHSDLSFMVEVVRDLLSEAEKAKKEHTDLQRKYTQTVARLQIRAEKAEAQVKLLRNLLTSTPGPQD